MNNDNVYTDMMPIRRRRQKRPIQRDDTESDSENNDTSTMITRQRRKDVEIMTTCTTLKRHNNVEMTDAEDVDEITTVSYSVALPVFVEFCHCIKIINCVNLFISRLIP